MALKDWIKIKGRGVTDPESTKVAYKKGDKIVSIEKEYDRFVINVYKNGKLKYWIKEGKYFDMRRHLLNYMRKN
jgi:hypothetical protein